MWHPLSRRGRKQRCSPRARLCLEPLERREVLDGGFSQFGSADAYTKFLVDSALTRYKDLFGHHFPSYYYYPQTPYVDRGVPAGFTALTDSTTASPSGGAGPGTFSPTNVQVQGVDEADIVKTDGDFLYVVRNQELVILKSRPAEGLGVVSRVKLNGNPFALYLNGDRLTVLSNDYGFATETAQPMVRTVDGFPLIRAFNNKTEVTVLDVSDRTAPKTLRQTDFEGSYLDSRAVGNFVYLVVQNYQGGLPAPAYTYFNGETIYETQDQYLARIKGHELDLALPHYYTRGADGQLTPAGFVADPAQIYEPRNANDYELLSVVSFDVTAADPGPTGSVTEYASYGSTVYASAANLYVARPQWQYDATTNTSSGSTTIDRFALGGAVVKLTATGSVPGQAYSQFNFDERDGYLRVVTTANWGPQATNALYVLADQGGTLTVVGSVTGIAPGQSTQAVRFMDDIAFIDTFQQVDPLWAVDLHSATSPKLLGNLKLPGFAHYLQPLDATHLLGVGRGGDHFGDLVLTLFDVSNPASPTVESQYTIAPEKVPTWWGWWGWTGSPAEWDHHALGYFADSHTLAVPVYGQFVDQDYLSFVSSVWVFDVDMANGFTLLGKVSHDSQALRSVQVDDNLYTIATNSVQVHGLRDPEGPGREVRLDGDAPRLPQSQPIKVLQGKGYSGSLVTFTVDDATNLSAQINWGDGQTSTGTLVPAGHGRYSVKGSHTFTQGGGHTVSINFSRGSTALNSLNDPAQVTPLDAATERFLNQAYKDLLHRAVDPTGLAGWAQALVGGTSRTDVARALVASTEYRGNAVNDLYATILGRSADAAGRAAWVNFLAQGHSVEEAKVAFLASGEFFARAGGSVGGFLQALYQNVLGRGVDAAGAQNWGRLLAQGTPRGDVIRAVVSSAEAATRTVQSIYATYLHRPADAAGLRVFVTALQQGRPSDEVRAQAVGSAEYFGKT